MTNNELADFLRKQCNKRNLSLRRLSVNAGLSPATVHHIIRRDFQPTLFSLNRLADYLGIRRPYLWRLAGLLNDVDYDETSLSDPELRHHLARVDKLPEAARKLVIDLIDAVIVFLETSGTD